MLGLLLLYFIGKYYYQLAFEFDKNKWLFAIVGIATYYACYFAFAFLGGMMIGFFQLTSILELPEIVLGLMFIPFGILGAWFLYYMLNKNWTNQAEEKNENILDSI